MSARNESMSVASVKRDVNELAEHANEIRARRLSNALIREAAKTLPEDFEIKSVSYDKTAWGEESLAVVMTVPSDESRQLGFQNHARACLIVEDAFEEAVGWHPDDGALLLSTYGVLPDGSLTALRGS